MAVVSLERGYLFVQAPKAASTAIGNLLRDRHGGVPLPSAVVRGADGSVVVRPKHATLSELVDGGVIEPATAAGLFKFVSVRNPFDALVSMWTRAGDRVREAEANPDHWLHREEGRLEARRRMAAAEFPEWIERRFARRRRATMYIAFAEGMDAVVRFERLDAELALALGRVGIDHDEPLHKVNPTRGRSADYRSYYTPRLRAMVESAFAEELARFGYDFDGVTTDDPIVST